MAKEKVVGKWKKLYEKINDTALGRSEFHCPLLLAI
jgi:hypothetical protein